MKRLLKNSYHTLLFFIFVSNHGPFLVFMVKESFGSRNLVGSGQFYRWLQCGFYILIKVL